MKVGYLIYEDTGRLDKCGITDASREKLSDIYSLSGANLGNFAFKYGASFLFDNPSFFISYSTPVEVVRKNCDVLVIPEANLVNPHVDYARQAQFIKNVDLPCFLLGVGAQANSFDDSFVVPDGTINFLKEVEKRTNKICVRGGFTKKILSQFNINNVEVTGCPSLMVNPSRHLWQKVKENFNANDFLKKMTVTEGVYPLSSRKENINKVEKFLFSSVAIGNADYLGQVQTSVVAYGLNRVSETVKDDVYYLSRYLAPYLSTQDFEYVLKNRAKAFVRIPDWMQYYKGRSGVIGTRIHGNLLALQAETPAIPIVHDTRTEELCSTMAIPFIKLSEITSDLSFEHLHSLINEKMKFSHAELDGKRSQLAQNYFDLVADLGLKPSAQLKHISKY